MHYNVHVESKNLMSTSSIHQKYTVYDRIIHLIVSYSVQGNSELTIDSLHCICWVIPIFMFQSNSWGSQTLQTKAHTRRPFR